jgi:hypothetical protein
MLDSLIMLLEGFTPVLGQEPAGGDVPRVTGRSLESAPLSPANGKSAVIPILVKM